MRARGTRLLAVGLALLAGACSDKLLGVAGTIAVSPAELDFGQVTLGTPQGITVQVSNQGSAALTIVSIKVSSDPNSELAVSDLLTTDCTGALRSGSTLLSPGECAQFNAIWTPAAPHPAAGAVEIDSDDSQNPAVTLMVTGTAIVPLGCYPPCGDNQVCCNDVCVDTESDPLHCGSCLACTQGASCTGGTCVTPPPVGCIPSCTAEQTCCDTTCYNTQTDPLNCGGCGIVCASGDTCVAGMCTPPGCNPACTATQACCDLTCIDIESDPAHCGGCTACPAGDSCTAGVCVAPVINNSCDPVTAPCTTPDICCNHVCIDGTPTAGVCPCTGGPTSNFGVGSIIIPEDVCWQRGQDATSTPSYCTNNRKTTGDDSPLKAYGLVFFLIRHQVTVYVAIDPNKTAIDGVDMALVSNSGPPVQRYNWSTGQAVALADQTQTTVQYRGGPFLIDASQHDNVMSLLATDPDFAQFRSEGNINIHIATVSFQSTIAKSIAAVPSRIALLSPKGDTSSYQILVRYLTSAGLNFTGAGGTPAAPGQIYDQLQESDFLPNYSSSNLKAGGYKLLWSPHWEGGTSNTNAQLATIGAFVNAGGDLFAECAAIGTLEGFDDLSFGPGGVVTGGSAATQFMTNKGMAGNTIPPAATNNNGSYLGPFVYAGLASPFAQRGDFTFAGFEGAISDFHPDNTVGSTYYSGVVTYVSTTGSDGVSTDLFTSYDQHAQGKGTVVYLSGHDYSYGGTGDTVGTTAGSRLVLNTLFSLGTNDVCQP